MYLTANPPNIMFVMSLINRYMENITEQHFQEAKRVLRHLKGTTERGIFYRKGGDDEFVAYTDTDYAGDVEDRKSSRAVSLSSKKQPVVSLSTSEGEFIVAASCACQAVWLRRVLSKLNQIPGRTTIIRSDRSSTIKLSKNPVMYGRTEHIDVCFHFRVLDGNKIFEKKNIKLVWKPS